MANAYGIILTPGKRLEVLLISHKDHNKYLLMGPKIPK